MSKELLIIGDGALVKLAMTVFAFSKTKDLVSNKSANNCNGKNRDVTGNIHLSLKIRKNSLK